MKDSFTLIGSVTFRAGDAGNPTEMVARMEELGRQHGAEICTLKDGPVQDFNVGIYIPSRTTHNPVPVTTSGQITIANPYGAATTGTYSATQTQYVPQTTSEVDTRRVIHIPSMVANSTR